MPSSKRCSKCAATKPLDEFYRNKSQTDGHHNWCVPCFKAGNKKYQSQPHVRARRAMQNKAREPFRTDRGYSREAVVLWQYGLSTERYDEILAAQGGRCAICRTDEPGGKGAWHIDHDHGCCAENRSCGDCVRGLLCSRCNPMIGMARDDVDVLSAAVDYLRGSGGVLVV